MTSAFHLVEHPQAPDGIARMASLADDAWQFHHSLPGYTPTPLYPLHGFARELGIGALWLKDESHRLGLNAFKALGASFAIHHWLATHLDAGSVTFTTATDGNHGRAVAWAARQTGNRAVIFAPAHTVPARIAAIEREGAQVVLVPEGYEAATRDAHSAAAAHGWVLIQDSAAPGYEEVPERIAAGYWTMARELEPFPHAMPAPEVDLVLLHAGVGTWAAAMTAYYWHRYRARRHRLAIVDPTGADCLIATARAGRPTAATGSLQTIMAGLNCGFPSTTAFQLLERSVDAFLAIPDVWAERAMRRLAQVDGGDQLVVAGESGAASVAGLMALVGDPHLACARAHLGLGAGSRVLVWSTEGATDPEGWARVVGRPVPA